MHDTSVNGYLLLKKFTIFIFILPWSLFFVFWLMFGAEGPPFRLHFDKENRFENMHEKSFFLQMDFCTKLLITKVDRSTNTCFLFCKLFIASKGHCKTCYFPGFTISKCHWFLPVYFVKIRLTFDMKKWLWKSEFRYIWPSVPNQAKYLEPFYGRFYRPLA